MAGEDDASGDALRTAASHVAASRTEWTDLKAAALGGELRFEPAAAERCAQVCETAVDQITDQLQTARQLTRVEGFGDTIAGRALADKFARKGGEAVDVLVAHRQVLQDMAATYRAAGRAYTEAEANNAVRLRGTEE